MLTTDLPKKFVIEIILSLSDRRDKSMHYPESPKVTGDTLPLGEIVIFSALKNCQLLELKIVKIHFYYQQMTIF